MNVIQQKRVNRLYKICQSRSQYLYGLNELILRQRRRVTHFYVSDVRRVIYCGVPKTGTSNWKRLLLILEGKGQNVSKMKNSDVHRQPLTKLFSLLNKEKVKFSVNNFFRFLFVRHPFERLASVYRNKFGDNNEYFEKTFGSNILRLCRKNLTAQEYNRGKGVTFKEFARWLIEKEVYDQHWAPMYRLCHPCVIPFDFVGKMMTFSDDAKYVTRIINSDMKFPTNAFYRYNTSSSDLMDFYFSQLPQSMINSLYTLYKSDFELFDYVTPYVSKEMQRDVLIVEG